MTTTHNHTYQYSMWITLCFLITAQPISAFQFTGNTNIDVSSLKGSSVNSINCRYVRSIKLHASSEDNDKRYDGFPVWFRIAEQKIAAYDETNNPDTSKNEVESNAELFGLEDDNDISTKQEIKMDVTNVNIANGKESESFAVQYPSKHWTMEKPLSKTTFSKSASFSYVLPKGIKLSGLTITADEEEEDVDEIRLALEKARNVGREKK